MYYIKWVFEDYERRSGPFSLVYNVKFYNRLFSQIILSILINTYQCKQCKISMQFFMSFIIDIAISKYVS